MVERDVSFFERPLLSFARSTNQRMALLSAAAGLVILQSALSDGGFSLIIAAAAALGALSAELLVSFLRRQRLLNDLSALCSGLVLAAMLPNTINPLFAFIGAVFAMTTVKGSFGGLGANWLNPALAAWLFVRFSWPEPFAAALDGSTLTAAGTISAITVPAGGFLYTCADTAIAFLNHALSRNLSCEIPQGFAAFMANAGPAIIADRGVLALIVASILITAGIHRFSLALIFLVPYLALIRLAAFIAGSGEDGDLFYCLFSGGTLLAAFMLAADPATGPKSLFGKICAALCTGILSFIFRYLNAELYGAFFAVAVVNVLCPLVREKESAAIYNRDYRPFEDPLPGKLKKIPGGAL